MLQKIIELLIPVLVSGFLAFIVSRYVTRKQLANTNTPKITEFLKTIEEALFIPPEFSKRAIQGDTSPIDIMDWDFQTSSLDTK